MALLLWWVFTFTTFWLCAVTVVWPYQLFTGRRFELTRPIRKLVVSFAVSFVQAIVFWVFITLAGRHVSDLFKLLVGAIIINEALVVIAHETSHLEGLEWKALQWIAHVQFVVWFGLLIIVTVVTVGS